MLIHRLNMGIFSARVGCSERLASNLTGSRCNYPQPRQCEQRIMAKQAGSRHFFARQIRREQWCLHNICLCDEWMLRSFFVIVVGLIKWLFLARPRHKRRMIRPLKCAMCAPYLCENCRKCVFIPARRHENDIHVRTIGDGAIKYNFS